MKKSALLIISCIVCALPMLAQVIPNAGMENWTAGAGFDEPTGWGTPNPYGIVVVSKSTDSHSGTYAARLASKNIIVVNVPGVMGTGAIDPLNFTINGGFPISEAYNEFNGYFKFYPKGGDSCWIFAFFTKWNTANNSRDTVGIANFYGGSTPAYTQFHAPIYYLLPEVPDSALVVAITSKTVLAGSDSSVLYLDDLNFSGSVGIANMPEQPVVQSYPNPANDQLIIRLPAGNDVKQLEVFDLLGNKKSTMKVSSGQVTLNTSHFPAGLYFYQLKDQSGKETGAGKFSVVH